MNLLMTAPTWLVALLGFFLLIAAVEDGWRLQIANLTSGVVALGAIIAAFLAGPSWPLWQNLLLLVLVLAAGTLMFARGAMGGGDVKLLAASSLWFDLATGWRMLVAVAIAGGIEALFLIGIRRIRAVERLADRVPLLRRREGIPYGIAIAGGVALTIWLTRR